MEKKKKTFKILSIDGGGIKGIYSAAVLAKFEEFSQKKIVDCFDLICGTSTGGLIGLLLGAGYSAKQIVQFYIDNASYIFPPKNRCIALIKQIFGINKHDQEGLYNVLKKFLENRTMEDSIVNLCIPSIDSENEKPIVFKTGHSHKYVRDPKISMVDVALATSAAPTFLPIHKIERITRETIDGGLWANNPSLVGIIEAMEIFMPQHNYDNFALLSIGNIESNTGCFKNLSKIRKINIFFLKKLIEFFMHIQVESIKNMVNHLKNVTNSTYDRITASKFSPEQYKEIELDTSNKKVLDILISKGYSDAEHHWANDNIRAYMTCKVELGVKND